MSAASTILIIIIIISILYLFDLIKESKESVKLLKNWLKSHSWNFVLVIWLILLILITPLYMSGQYINDPSKKNKNK